MIYVLHSADPDSPGIYGVFEGPDGLDIDSLCCGFWDRFKVKSSPSKRYAEDSRKNYQEIQASYPGNSMEEMLISYLEKEHGFKKADAKLVDM